MPSLATLQTNPDESGQQTILTVTEGDEQYEYYVYNAFTNFIAQSIVSTASKITPQNVVTQKLTGEQYFSTFLSTVAKFTVSSTVYYAPDGTAIMDVSVTNQPSLGQPDSSLPLYNILFRFSGSSVYSDAAQISYPSYDFFQKRFVVVKSTVRLLSSVRASDLANQLLAVGRNSCNIGPVTVTLTLFTQFSEQSNYAPYFSDGTNTQQVIGKQTGLFQITFPKCNTTNVVNSTLQNIIGGGTYVNTPLPSGL